MSQRKELEEQEPGKQRPLVFIHLPKTAGASLIAGLLKQFRKEEIFHIRNLFPVESLERFRDLEQSEKANIRLLAGHHAHLFHPELPDPLLACMFRDPVRQFLSARSHLLRSTFNPRHQEVIGLNGLDEYLDWAERTGFTNNQTWYLSHSEQELRELRVQKRPVDKEDLQRAMSLLESIEAPMIAEHLEDSILMLCAEMSWPKFELGWRNKSPREEVQAPNDAQIERIRKLQWADIILHQAALERYTNWKAKSSNKRNLLQPKIMRKKESRLWKKLRFYLGLEDTSWMRGGENEKGRTS